jgi:hypothetical protein
MAHCPSARLPVCPPSRPTPASPPSPFPQVSHSARLLLLDVAHASGPPQPDGPWPPSSLARIGLSALLEAHDLRHPLKNEIGAAMRAAGTG